MHLKQVEMENFKSFGGKVVVPFKEGYTAVTGPNGSGKSNITDAILFVLGPKSSKAVRAGKLSDLVFDGGKSKNKAGFTKVSLVFDNSDRLMPWDDDVVRLTRYVKLAENGTDYTSYFYVNDRKSTMGEFDSLLTKARISADGYNLVQQGDVTHIVQMGSIERRRILDGISGIASFDTDIEHARSERAEAQSNLDRVSIIVTELDAQVSKLAKEREDAAKYMAAKSDLDMAKAQYSHRRLQMAEAARASQEEQIRTTLESIESGQKEKEAMEVERDAKAAEVEDIEAQISAKVGPEYKELKEKIESAKIEMATRKDRAETAESDLEEQTRIKEGFEQDISDNDAEVAGLKEDRESESGKLSAAKEALESAEKEEKEIADSIASVGGEHKVLQDRLNELEGLIHDSSEALRQSQGELSKASAIAEEARSALSSAEEGISGVDFELKEARWSLSQLKEEAGPSLEDYTRKIMGLKSKESELEKQESELAAAYRRIDGEYNAMQAEKKVTERMNRGNAAVEAIISLRNKGEMSGIHGTIQELATVASGFETALAVAAGGKMQAVVVDDDQVAADAIDFLKKNKLGRVTFLPLTKMMGGKPRAKALMTVKDTEGLAIDLIDFDQKYYNAFWYVLGDTLIVRDMTVARRIMGGIRIVTKQGELIEASGAMIGGNISQQNLMKFGAASENKLAELGERLRRASDAVEDVRSQLRQVRAEIREADDKMREANSSGMAQREQIAQIKGKIGELEKSRKTLAETLQKAKGRLSEAESAEEEARRAFSDASGSNTALTDERTKVKDRISEIAPVELQSRIAEVRDRIFALKTEVSDRTLKIGEIDVSVTGYEKQNESLRTQIASISETMEEDRRVIEENRTLMERAKVDLDALRAIESKMESGISDLRLKKEDALSAKFDLDGRIREKVKDMENARAAVESFRSNLNAMEDQVAAYRAEVDAITIEVAMPIPSEEEIRRIIRRCENAIAQLGNVNLRAIEDYETRKARLDELNSQVDEINARIDELNALMDSLASKKKGLFMLSYNAVNENFKSIYAELSGGGEAYMGLENEDDPFSGGLMINAKPKNGKLLRLEALSGGEKSLTALSFIFAIQEHQPSPFYVLDEVDMFLDSVNAEMVAKRVKSSSVKAQFIQVSLRKVTLVLADHLIGVTRPPSGISRVIMQPDLAEVSKYEEQAAKAEGDGQ